MDRKVLIGLAIGAAALTLIGRRRRPSLGGLGVAPRSFKPNRRAWAKGARVEQREHGLTMKVARRIAADHLFEDPRYYERGLGALGLPADQHAIRRVGRSGKSRALGTEALNAARRGDCALAYERLVMAEYESGQVSAHASSTTDAADPKLPRAQMAAARELRADLKSLRGFLAGQCIIVPRRRAKRDTRQRRLPGV